MQNGEVCTVHASDATFAFSHIWNRHRDSALPMGSTSYEVCSDATRNDSKTMPTTVTRRVRSFVVAKRVEMSWSVDWVRVYLFVDFSPCTQVQGELFGPLCQKQGRGCGGVAGS